MTAYSPCRYQTTQLFDAGMPPDFGLQPLPETPNAPLVSIPELELVWAKIVHPHSQHMGCDRRWMLRTRNGELLSLKK